MAFDQNSIPKDLRPLNIVRSTPEESRIAPVATSGRAVEGFYANPPRDVTSPRSAPLYYNPAMVTDAGLAGLGYNNAPSSVAGWVPHVPPVIVGTSGVNPAIGHCYNPNVGTRVGVISSDQGSEEGGEDSVSGKKVKFLCSYGGKILPRPSDGVLRYVGGQTRIITVRRNVSFNELVQKMTDTYGQNVIIKYQLPEEELDALVSVSCPDDLDNMMDEYDKLVERSTDGSVKLRVFLFSASDIDSSFGDLQASGKRYFEAVNGITEGGGGITRRDSITSAASTQNSDLSGIEPVDNAGYSHDDATGLPSTVLLSPRRNSTTSQESGQRLVVDPSQANYADASALLANSAVKTGYPLSSQPEPAHVIQQQLAFDLQQPGVNFPAPASYLQAYVDPRQRQETVNHSDYAQQPPGVGFPPHLLGTVGPVFTHQQFSPGMSPQQFIPAVHMTMTPSTHVMMRPNMVQPSVHPNQVQLERYPEENTFSQRGVQVPGSQSYSTYQAQVPAPVMGGGYGWNQVQVIHPEQVTFSEGWVPQPQQQVMAPEKIARLEDCHMCQKALPHAHSDTLVQGQRESPVSTISDSNIVYHSLRLDDKGRPNKWDNTDHPNVTAAQGVVGLSSGLQSPYGAFVGNSPQVASDIPSVGGMPFQASDHLVFESPKDFSGKFPKEDTVQSAVTYDHLRQIDGRMGNLGIHSPEALVNNELSKSQVDNPKWENVNHAEPNEMLYQAVDSNEVPQPPRLGTPGLYPQPNLSANYLVPDEIASTGPAFVAADPAHTVERITPIGQWKDNCSRNQTNIAATNVEVVSSDGNTPTSLSSSDRVANVQDSSNSLFSNQDPWSLHHDTHFPPPRPNKILTKKEDTVSRNPFGDSRFGDSAESLGNVGGLRTDLQLDDGAYEPSSYLHMDIPLEHGRSNKSEGSAEELIKQELQAVAEGVAASVLRTSAPSNPNSAEHGRSESHFKSNEYSEVKASDGELPDKEKSEDISIKTPQKSNFGFPLSDGIGRLQIIKNSDLEELRELGSGTFGTVYHGKWRGSDVAIKRINDRCFAGKPSEQERMRDDFWNEAIKLADLHHPNVVAFYGVVLDGPGGSVATVTEFMVNGSLRTALQKNERQLDKQKRILIAMDVAFGMEYLHGKNIVHFDLKSDNLLVNLRDPHRPICKVGDLGLSKVKCQTLISGGVRGTLPWMAPELLNGSSSLVSEKVDVFSFGIVLWELLTGEEPYADLHYGAIIGGIVSNTLRPAVPESCDLEWRLLMEKCWSSEPSERPNFTEIANHLRSMAAKIPIKGQNPTASS